MKVEFVKKYVDEKTFAPKAEFKVTLPLESLMDSLMLVGETNTEQMVGAEFVSQIKQALELHAP